MNKVYKEKHKWEPKEDYICCEAYLLRYLSNDNGIDFDDFIYNLTLKLPNISKNSIIYKLQNIKALCEKYKIKDNANIKPLNHFSEQNEIVFKMILLQSDIQKLLKQNKENNL